MSDEKYVMKINMAMSNKPLFVQITDPAMSLDTILQEAVKSLKNSKPLESQQLEQLYKTHQMFNNGKVFLKGALFKELDVHEQAVGNNTVKVAELDLIASHSGGLLSDSSDFCSNLFSTLTQLVGEKIIAILEVDDRNYTKKIFVFESGYGMWFGSSGSYCLMKPTDLQPIIDNVLNVNQQNETSLQNLKKLRRMK